MVQSRWSLLRPGTIKAVTSVLDEQFVERTVFFPVFARYFLARGRSFEIMIEDLFKHKASQSNKPHLVLSADVPRLRNIAHKRMGYLRATYRLFKDTVSETEKDNRALVKSHMKMCVKHYHALIPQLDIIETQLGVKIEDALCVCVNVYFLEKMVRYRNFHLVIYRFVSQQIEFAEVEEGKAEETRYSRTTTAQPS
jgi:hypothetical protein